MMTFTAEEIFDKIVDEVGRNGLFQRRFLILFNSALVFFGTIAYFSINLSLAVPDHWCTVPGRNHTNYTSEQWKLLTIPWTNDSSGKKEFSKCEMYNELGNNQSNKTACRHGWEYDDKWFSQTLASKYNWVCDDSIYITNAFTFLAIGDIAGSIFFGQIGDLYGRKPVYLTSLLFIIAGRTASIFTADIYLLFLLALVIGSSSSVSLYQSPLVVLMEISNEEDRSFLTMVQNMSYTAGFCIMPLMFWVLRDWTMFSLIAVAPLLGYLFINRFMIESPRWLVDKSRKEECIKELKKIAKINKTTIPKYLIEDLARSELIVEKVYGTMSLFSSWGMTKMTLLIVIQCITFMPVYGILCLNLNNLEGNPFMNYFWQALAEAPGLISAKFACDIIGRRFSRLFGYLVGIIAGAFLIYIVSGGTGNETAVTILSVVLKFSAAFSGYAVYLNSMELFPTCVRQTGLSFGYTMGCLLGLACPYFIYLGTEYNRTYPYIIVMMLSVCGLLSGIFLPETLHQKIPTTLKEAEVFGNGQPFWKIPKVTHNLVSDKELMEF